MNFQLNNRESERRRRRRNTKEIIAARRKRRRGVRQDGEVVANTRCPPLLHLDSPGELQLSLGGGRLRPCGKILRIERLDTGSCLLPTVNVEVLVVIASCTHSKIEDPTRFDITLLNK